MSSAVTGGDDIRFWAGHATPASAPFRVSEAGALVATSANVSGAITANSGTIGSFTIGTYLYTGSKTAWNDTNAGVHIGSDGIGIGNNVFTVNGSTGALTSTSGTIGGMTIATNSLSATASGNTITIDASLGRFTTTRGLAFARLNAFDSGGSNVTELAMSNNGVARVTLTNYPTYGALQLYNSVGTPTVSASGSTGTVTAGTFTGTLIGTASGNLVSGGALGTPSSGVLTNCTGTASGLTSGACSGNAATATTASNSNALGGTSWVNWCKRITSSYDGTYATPIISNVYFTMGGSLGGGYKFACSGNTVTATDISDSRLKLAIMPEALGLDFIRTLKPRIFRMRHDPALLHHGFIADDLGDLLQTEHDGLHHRNADGTRGMGAPQLIGPIVNAIQQLSAKFDAHLSTIH